ncbi:hypothetical protein E2562_038872 [Oryza meyeriana var. granulata]|uniref:Uncharacterized protein n=1 Tax=Oryza meyeriana var. granulata TaxID=110450 RepID=A0A6G1FGQ4_9ORYZ|nr:hypothetical protein E2562_038872 [Oryza meyeriana var. granulata]
MSTGMKGLVFLVVFFSRHGRIIKGDNLKLWLYRDRKLDGLIDFFVEGLEFDHIYISTGKALVVTRVI